MGAWCLFSCAWHGCCWPAFLEQEPSLRAHVSCTVRTPSAALPSPGLFSPPAPALRCSDSTDPEYYGGAYDWLLEDESELLGLLLTLSPQAPSVAAPAGDAPSDAPALPVYAVFASSSRAPVVPSTADANASAAPAKAKPLELIVAPLGVGAKPPRAAADRKDFDPRCAWLWGSGVGGASSAALQEPGAYERRRCHAPCRLPAAQESEPPLVSMVPRPA